MKYIDLNIQTQREFTNEMRTQVFGWLARTGYVTRENELTDYEVLSKAEEVVFEI